MKNIYILICFILAGSVSSCSDFLSSPSQSSFSEESVFRNEKLTENMIFNVYSFFAQTNSHRGRFQPYYGMNTDIEMVNATDLTDATSLCNYSAVPANSQMSGTKDPNTWTCFYNAIEAANVCLAGIEQYGNPTPDNLMGYFYGEALVLRATFYYDLLRGWGDVPARFAPVTSATIYMEKSDRDIIYKQIINDLEKATDYLPWPNESERTTTVERINKAYAKALRARLCLMAAGYSQRPLDDNDHEGSEIRLSTDPDLQKEKLYPIAKKELEDIVKSKKCQLSASFENFFKDLCQDKVDAGGESLFELPFADGRGRWMQTFAIYHYDKDKYLNTTKKGGQNVPTPTLYYDFDTKDLRRDITCVPYKWQGGKQVLITSEPTQKAGWNFGKYRYEWMQRVVSGDDSINQPYVRYSDVLLMLAEVLNELDDLEGAKKYLEMVRKRAFKEEDWSEKVEDYIARLLTKEQFFNAIVDERKFEFAGEMLRKGDLIRWNLLGKNVKETKRKMDDLRNYRNDYTNLPRKVYYRQMSDGESIEVYGFNVGEDNIPQGDGWQSVDWQKAAITDARVERFYVNEPDKRQFWPIFQSDLDTQMGSLINDYGY